MLAAPAGRLRQLITSHAPHIQVVVLRSRHAARRYLADVPAQMTANAREAAIDGDYG
jgi:hypothetical protein